MVVLESIIVYALGEIFASNGSLDFVASTTHAHSIIMFLF